MMERCRVKKHPGAHYWREKDLDRILGAPVSGNGGYVVQVFAPRSGAFANIGIICRDLTQIETRTIRR